MVQGHIRFLPMGCILVFASLQVLILLWVRACEEPLLHILNT